MRFQQNLVTMQWTVFVFVQLITTIYCVGHCPSGLLWHQNVLQCCQPITYCGPGYEVQPCKVYGEFDTCERCREGLKNYFNTSSFDIKTCKLNKCPSDTTLDANGKCVCNLFNGYTGTNPKLCFNEGRYCPKGKELQLNGKCTTCAFGFYKDWEGYGFCKKQINCKLLRLDYKKTGNFQTAAICKKPQRDQEVSDDTSQTKESQTSSVYSQMIPIERPESQPSTEYVFKSEQTKQEPNNKRLFNCDFQIIVVVLGVLLVLLSTLVVYFIITRKSASKKTKKMSAVPLQRNTSEVGWSSYRSQRPLPVLPRQETYSIPDSDQYIPMTASRHPSCSNANRQEHSLAFQQQDINNTLMYQRNELNMSSSPSHNMATTLNESGYVKIEPF